MSHWSLDDIPWQKFDRSKLSPDLVAIAKAAAMVEHNGLDYERYLREVFHDDEAFKEAVHEWAIEEVQHGQALRKWAELADPAFDFEKSFKAFTDGYKLPMNVDASVRGSRTGELVARCIVETGTSSYYTAIADSTDEPVLKAVCQHIAADELRHWKLFYTHLKRYLEKEKVTKWERLKIALSRIGESEDDELSYAYYAAHHAGTDVPYDRKTYNRQYMARAYSVYQRHHVSRMIAMVFKAIGLKPQGFLSRFAEFLAWNIMRVRNYLLRAEREQVMPVAA